MSLELNTKTRGQIAQAKEALARAASGAGGVFQMSLEKPKHQDFCISMAKEAIFSLPMWKEGYLWLDKNGYSQHLLQTIRQDEDLRNIKVHCVDGCF